jgi:hypothetical protein
MARLVVFGTIAILGVGGWWLLTNYKFEVHRGADGRFDYFRVIARSGGGAKPGLANDLPPAAPARPAIRVATFDLDGLDEFKLANPQVCDALVRVLPHFDVIAIQGIHSKNRAVLVRLIEQINATGRFYDFAICPTLDRDPVESFNAMLFDQTTVEVDRTTVHTVDDPAKRFRVRPLMASFRVRGPPEAEAFTFTAVNVLVDSDRAEEELDLLADVFRAVRDNGRGEDDVILLGDLEADPEHLGRLGQVPDLTAAVTAIATTTRGTRLVDNLLFDRRATVEYTGRSGVIDLIRDLDLTPQAALEISEHLPTWAEFSSYEGGQPGQVP